MHHDVALDDSADVERLFFSSPAGRWPSSPAAVERSGSADLWRVQGVSRDWGGIRIFGGTSVGAADDCRAREPDWYVERVNDGNYDIFVKRRSSARYAAVLCAPRR